MGNNNKPEIRSAGFSFPEFNSHPVLVCRGSGHLTYVNPAAEQLVADLVLASANELLPLDHKRIKEACLESSEPITVPTTVKARIITWTYRPVAREAAVYLYGVDLTQHTMSASGSHNSLQLAALNKMATGIVAVDRGLNVLFRNNAADAMFSSDGVLILDNKLVSCVRPITEKIRLMVTAALQGREAPAAISIPRPSQSSIELLVSPTTSATSSAVIVFLFDEQVRSEPTMEILASLYGLTPAEARLVALLANGMSLPDVGIALKVSSQTVRNQLQAVYGKTGTNRQGELIRRVQSGGAGTALLHAHASPSDGKAPP